MKNILIPLVLVTVCAGLGSAQSYHDGKYLCGGYGSSCHSYFLPGIWIVGSDGSARSAIWPGFYTDGWCMDADNKRVVFTVGGPGTGSCYQAGPRHGIYAVDPATQVITTVYGPDALATYIPSKVFINHDGDYVVSCVQMVGTQQTTAILKIDHLTRQLSTLLTTAQLGRAAWLGHKIIADIDSGQLLVADGQSPYPVWQLAHDGSAVTCWCTGGSYGWRGYNSLPQEHATGYLCGAQVMTSSPNYTYICQLQPGAGSRTTVCPVRMGSSIIPNQFNYHFDLQTAAAKRWVGTTWNYRYPGVYEQLITYIAHNGGGQLSTLMVNQFAYNKCAAVYDLDFYRGRNIQTVRTAPNVWDIRISCPQSGGYQYRMAASAAGVRPGIALPDGRKINLNWDTITAMTLLNLLPGVWNPGTQQLDPGGEALGQLDLSTLPVPPGGYGIPLWIAVVVLDPHAPNGVKYVPDTYVMRI